MPREITLTTLPITSPEALRDLLNRFEEQTGIHVKIRWIEWNRYRQETVNISLQRQHVDVSMVGMPVTSDLEGMNALRPFSQREITSIGGAGAFLPARWQSGIRPDSTQVWALPMCLDVRVLAYWRDRLDQAGIDEATAFTSHAQIEQTVRRLKEAGIDHPWAMPTGFQLLHAVSSWIWEEGGDLFNHNGRRVLFHEPEAIRGMCAYFSLAAYSAPTDATLESLDSLFFNREIALCVCTPSVLALQNDPRLGIVPLPGGSYVGGVDLVIWGQTTDELASLELVRFLTQPSLTQPPSMLSSYLPVRIEPLQDPSNWPTPAAQGVAQAALHGRAYPCVAMVGLVEERLSMTLEQILKDLSANPGADVEATVRARMEPLARRINLSLSQE
jgi:multiple sugar transport system substrate-binding protein